MKATLYGLVACALLVPAMARASCNTNPLFTGPVPTGSTASVQDDTNFGYYAWDESRQEWVLQEKAFFASAEQASMVTGDVFFGQEVFSGGGGGGRGPSPGTPTLPYGGCDDPVDMPRVVATAPRPSGGMFFMTMYRPPALRIGGGGFGRKTKGGVKQADKNVRCANDYQSRKFAALKALPKLMFAPGVWVVRYGGGDFEVWAVTAPTFSDKGLVSQGCKAG